MRTIWKFPLAVMDAQPIRMPKGAKILTVQRQGEGACLWAMVDSGHDTELRVFEIHGTGNPIAVEMGIEQKYIGTFQSPPLVWHVFERIN